RGAGVAVGGWFVVSVQAVGVVGLPRVADVAGLGRVGGGCDVPGGGLGGVPGPFGAVGVLGGGGDVGEQGCPLVDALKGGGLVAGGAFGGEAVDVGEQGGDFAAVHGGHCSLAMISAYQSAAWAARPSRGAVRTGGRPPDRGRAGAAGTGPSGGAGGRACHVRRKYRAWLTPLRAGRAAGTAAAASMSGPERLARASTMNHSAVVRVH